MTVGQVLPLIGCVVVCLWAGLHVGMDWHMYGLAGVFAVIGTVIVTVLAGAIED